MTAQAGGASPSSIAAEQRALRQTLRQQLRRLRRAIPPQHRRAAALAVARSLARHPLIKPGARIGIYLAMRDELSLDAFIRVARLRRCQLFIPNITHQRRRQMRFYQLYAHSRLQLHGWGIPQLRTMREPPTASIMLDLVLVPLLGFDARGNRLGLGGGFYDRHFARLQRNNHWRRPRLMGVGYACQQLPALDSEQHDVRLDYIVTEAKCMRVASR